MSAAQPCQQELAEAESCIQQQPSSDCLCFDDNFSTEFARKTRFSYNQVQAFITTDDPDFCDTINLSVCSFFVFNHGCCCRESTTKYRRCLVEKTLPEELGTVTCQNDCSTINQSDAGIISDTVLVGVIGASLFLVMTLAYFFTRRRRAKKAAQSNVTNENIQVLETNTLHTASSDELGFLEDGKSSDPHHNTLGYSKRSRATSSKSQRAVSARTTTKSQDLIALESKDEDELIALKKEAGQDGESKRDVLKRKRDRIEAWRRDRMNGSSQSLEEYLSDDGSSGELQSTKQHTTRAQPIPNETKGSKHHRTKSPSRRNSNGRDHERKDISEASRLLKQHATDTRRQSSTRRSHRLSKKSPSDSNSSTEQSSSNA